jgi:hypothetical protein
MKIKAALAIEGELTLPSQVRPEPVLLALNKDGKVLRADLLSSA